MCVCECKCTRVQVCTGLCIGGHHGSGHWAQYLRERGQALPNHSISTEKQEHESGIPGQGVQAALALALSSAIMDTS